MKRIIICCDGTWNNLDSPQQTNVVYLAENIALHDDAENQQIIYYNAGIGTHSPILNGLNRLIGGAFGTGLIENVQDCYRFLVFNFEVGDEIFIFGFSRGAYTARSLGGLIRNCGILPRSKAHEVKTAYELYASRAPEDHPDLDRSCEFRLANCPDYYTGLKELEWRKAKGRYSDNLKRLRIRYVGVWDTVGALGIPNHIPFSKPINRKHRFHDHALSRAVCSA